MSRRPGPRTQIRTLPAKQLLQRLTGRDFASEACIKAFLERCMAEAFRSSDDVLLLASAAPDYVERVLTGKPRHQTRLMHALGILATHYTTVGQPYMAELTFDQALTLNKADPAEQAGLTLRRAYHTAVMRPAKWSEAYRLASEAVAFFQTDEGAVREDCSLENALAVRGIVSGLGYQYGCTGADPDLACHDFATAAETQRRLPRTQIVAVSGLSNMAVILWMSDQPMQLVTPGSLAARIKGIRKQLRKRRIIIETIVDAKCRWMLALATFMLSGRTLSQQAEHFFAGARKTLLAKGCVIEAAQLTLDLQWCLLESGRTDDAALEGEFLVELNLPADWNLILDAWQYQLAKNSVTRDTATQLFSKVRGIRDVSFPVHSQHAGW